MKESKFLEHLSEIMKLATDKFTSIINSVESGNTLADSTHDLEQLRNLVDEAIMLIKIERGEIAPGSKQHQGILLPGRQHLVEKYQALAE